MITDFLLGIFGLLTELKETIVAFITEELRPLIHEIRVYIRTSSVSAANAALPENTQEASGNYDRYVVTAEGLANGVWLAKEAAWIRLGICRDTLDRKLAANVLRAYHRKGDEQKKKPRVFLATAEVEQHYCDYTLKKGKE